MSLLWFLSADWDADVGVRSGYHCLTWPESCKLRPVASELSIPSCLTTPSNVTLLLLEVRTPQRS